MKTRLVKKVAAFVVAFAGALCAFADTVVTSDSVEATTGTLAANGNSWTASALTYIAPTSNDSLNRSETGWYAGIKRTWALSYTGTILNRQYTGTAASGITASFSDNAGRTIEEYSVVNALNLLNPDASPDGGGIRNAFQTGGLTRYMKTVDWNVWVTPEIMKAVSEKGEDYIATLTIADETYTITIPRTLELVDDKGVQCWPEPEFDEPVSIEDAAITLSATEIIVRGETIGVELSQVTVNKVLLTEGTDYVVDESSVFQATDVGEYTVTLNGIGNYKGSASTTWKIIEPTGEFAADAMSVKKGDPAYGSIAAETPRRLDITDTTKLVYKNDELGERWEAAVVISWPHEVTSRSILQAATSVRYTDAEHATVAYSDDAVAYGNEILDGEVDWLSATTGNAEYWVGLTRHTYTYFNTLTWTVPLYADEIADAIESGAKHLEFSIKCGSVAWGDETEGNEYGLKETEFTVDLKLADVFLLDNEGTQVYPHHDHDWHYSLSEDGTTLSAKCYAAGCFLSQTEGDLSINIESKDAKNPDYAEGHYRDGKPAEAILQGATEFAAYTGAAIGEVGYETEDGVALEGAPVEPGRYVAYAVITSDASQGEAGSWTLRIGGLEILAGEAVLDGVHAKDAATYLEKTTGDAMVISAGKSYTAAKAYVVPARYGLLNLQTCGTKTYDLAGFTVTAAVDSPLFENAGRLVIRDTSESGTGTASVNQASAEDVLIRNTGTLTIESGTFVGSIVNEGGTVALMGGRYTVKPEASYVAEDYDLVRRGNYWSVEKHEHKYIVHSLANRLLIANCMNVLADGTLQISHCSGRMLVGVVGIRKSGLLTQFSVPQLSVDYDRKEHPAEFYAINLSSIAELLRTDGLFEMVRAVIESDPTNLDLAGVLELLRTLAQNSDFAQIIEGVGDVFVSESEFEAMTGATIGEISYTMGGEPIEGAPVEAGLYTATLNVETAMGTTWTLKGTYKINEKELPIETEGHSAHIWTFSVEGAKVTANCPGNILTGVKCNASPMSLELVPSAEGGRKVYDAQPLDVVVSNLNTFVINTDANVTDLAYFDADGNELEAAPVEPGEYTASITVSSGTIVGALIKHTVTLPLVIEEKTPTGKFPVCGWTKHVGRCTDALQVEGEALYYPVELAWPHMVEQIILTPQFTDPAHAEVRISTVRRTFSGEQLLAGEGEQWGLTADAGEFFRIKKFRNQTYMKGITWYVPFAFAEIDEARAKGEKEIVRTITLEGKCCEDNMEGLAPTTYTVILDVENLVINDAEGRQTYPVHKHSWKTENTGSTLSLVCEVEDCPQAPGLVADLSVDCESKVYDMLPVKATLSGTDAMRIHAAVEFGAISYVELGEEGAEYPIGDKAPSTPGRYRAQVDYSNNIDVIGTLSAEFEILPLDASDMRAYFDEPRMVFVYTGETQTPGLSSVWYGIVPLRYGVDYVVEGTIIATEAGEYSFTIVGIGKFGGRLEFEWRIVEPSRPFAPFAFQIPGGMCSPHWGVIGCDGKTAYVVNSTNLIYDAAEERWTAPLTIDWPENIDGRLSTPAIYTDPDHAKIETDCGDVVLVTSFFKRPLALCPEEYVVKVLWLPSFTMDDVLAAFNDGKDELVFELTVGSNAWEYDPFGLKTTTYRLVVPIKGLAHDDEEPIDWYWIEYLGNGAESGEMEVERRLVGTRERLTRSKFAKAGVNLLGWSFDDEAVGLQEIDFADYQMVSGDEFTVGVTNVVYAIWTTNLVICADIVNTNASEISSIELHGVGETDKESSVAGRAFGSASPWRYVFEVAQSGYYDIVVGFEDGDGEESIVTTLVQAEEGDSTTEKEDSEPVGSPVGGISSVVDNSDAGDYSVIAGGLDVIAASEENIAEVAANKRVDVLFKVAEKPSDDTTSGYDAIKATAGTSFIKPLDFSIIRYVDGVPVNMLHDVSSFGTTVKAIMSFDVGGRRNFRVVRYHEDTAGDPMTGNVTPLPEGSANANTLGEYFELNPTAGELTISGAKFSTYALLWDGAEVGQKSMTWHVDWLSGLYIPSIELEVADGNGWANTVSNMYFLLEKRDWAQLWDMASNAPVSTTEVIDGKTFYKVSLRDRFDVAGADSDKWGAVWYDETWVNAQLSEIRLYAPKYWPQNPKDVPDLDNLIAYVAYESYGCESNLKVGANKTLVKKLSAKSMKSAKPASAANLNTSLAVGAAVSDETQPYCKLAEFAVEGGVAYGKVEVGAGDTAGSLGQNAEVHILGAKNLGEAFVEIAQVECDESGNFVVDLPEGYMFFKVELNVSESIK